jgi:hypothetical protein
MIDPPAAPDKAEQLLFECRDIDQHDTRGVQQRLQRLVGRRLREVRDGVGNPGVSELRAERLARVAVASHASYAVRSQRAYKPFNGTIGIERRDRPLVLREVDNHSAIGVTVPDGEHGIVGGPAAHVDERGVVSAAFRRPR